MAMIIVTRPDQHYASLRYIRGRIMTSSHRSGPFRVAIAVVAVVALLFVAGVSGGSPSARPRSGAFAWRAAQGPDRARPRALDRGAAASSATTPSPGRPSPGSLPQTHVYPSAQSPYFRSLMASLWAGIVRDSLVPAEAAFFPKGAYIQLKAIAGAGSDWSNRLVHDYRLDLAAAHALLGGDAAQAQLVAVDVPSGYGHWVPPGVCYNRAGYYEVPNARVVYREHGRIRSFGIASMISWRGVWYVVHLGAILRSTDSGRVDEPAVGRGRSVYSGTC
jgi:hypothetical protein